MVSLKRSGKLFDIIKWSGKIKDGFKYQNGGGRLHQLGVYCLIYVLGG